MFCLTSLMTHNEQREMCRPYKVSSDVHTSWMHGRGMTLNPWSCSQWIWTRKSHQLSRQINCGVTQKLMGNLEWRRKQMTKVPLVQIILYDNIICSYKLLELLSSTTKSIRQFRTCIVSNFTLLRGWCCCGVIGAIRWQWRCEEESGFLFS